MFLSLCPRLFAPMAGIKDVLWLWEASRSRWAEFDETHNFQIEDAYLLSLGSVDIVWEGRWAATINFKEMEQTSNNGVIRRVRRMAVLDAK